MKKVFLALGIVLSGFILNAQVQMTAQPQAEPIVPTSKSKLEFAETTHDFGDIVQGDKVTYTFKFKNTGEEPLILSNVMTTCGCTATNWPRNPIPPNGTSEITATFNSAGKMGKQNKVITVVSNAMNGNQRVSIISNVTPAPTPATPTTVSPTPLK